MSDEFIPGRWGLLRDIFLGWGVDLDTAHTWVARIIHGSFDDVLPLLRDELAKAIPAAERRRALLKQSRQQKALVARVVSSLDPSTELAFWPLELPGYSVASTSRCFTRSRSRRLLVGFNAGTIVRVNIVGLSPLGWYAYANNALAPAAEPLDDAPRLIAV